MILSFFLRLKECHIYTNTFSKIYKITETREVADNILCFIQEAIENNENRDIEKLIFSSGPGSFTSVRIVNSIAKGLYIVNKATKFISVSSFLTYLYSLSTGEGLIAIPTMRGDFFVAEYYDNILKEFEILSIEDIGKYRKNTIFEFDEAFNSQNLARNQFKVLSSELAVKNKSLVSDLLHVSYGFTPEYKH
ncbi:MAG: hypothetical protein LBU35_01255 [Holosporales bacterium]|nr:hypothetical protein [Holosporales bacterium]